MSSQAPHQPVLLAEVLEALSPVEGGVFVDGTFGAGGYSSALLRGGAARVVGIDRDATAIAAGAVLVAEFGGRLSLHEARFADLETVLAEVEIAAPDGVVLDIGVSSMQLDRAERGFSFRHDGPLDMRMGAEGESAAELVNTADEALIADILYHYGEERASRRIAKAIVAARAEAPIETTGALAEVIERAMPAQRPGQIHPATRSFQALRIAVNDELGQLAAALFAAERALGPGGRLAVVTFHSLEDRIVKRFFQLASGRAGQGSRHAPAAEGPAPRFERPMRPAVPSEAEVDANPRARSARLRAAVRTDAPAVEIEPEALGLPRVGRAQPGRSSKGRAR